MKFHAKQISSLVCGLALATLASAHVTATQDVEWDPHATVSMSEEKKDTGKRTSIVLNWISVCQDLCSLNLVSPSDSIICGPQSGCNSSQLPQITDDDESALCRLLCENSLGGPRCNNCTSFASKSAVIGSVMPNFTAICTAMRCELNVNVNGCSACFDTKIPSSMTTTKQLPSSEKQESRGTTPDWIGLCVVFCSQGQGGSACNCDKLPFFRSVA